MIKFFQGFFGSFFIAVVMFLIFNLYDYMAQKHPAIMGISLIFVTCFLVGIIWSKVK